MTRVDEIAPFLETLARGAREALGDGLVGAYVVGSFALGCADTWSDVDVLVATDGPPRDASLAALRALHARLPDDSGWSARLEVAYADIRDLRSPMTLGRRWWHVDDGARELELSARDNTAHTRWVLREHGITLLGPEPRELVAEVTPDVLRAEALGAARAVAEEVEDHPDRLTSARWQPFLVLTACRVLHTAVHADVVGGAAAARSALAVLDVVHRDVVERALADRRLSRDLVPQRADPALAAPTRALLWDVVRLSGAAALAARG